jgi:hypothetical protein
MRPTQARESLWLDELHTAWVVAGEWDEIPQRAKAGNQSPLYFYVVSAVTNRLGMTELALRLASILAGAALAPLSFLLVRRWSGSMAGAIAAGAIALVDRDFLFYATEARVYAMLQVLALIRLAVFVELQTAPSAARRAAYIVLAAVMLHLHYTTALLLIGEAACVAALTWRRWRRRLSDAPAGPPSAGGAGASLRSAASHPSALRYRPRLFLTDAFLVLLLFLPAAPHAWEVFQRRENWARFVALPTWEQLASERFVRRAAPLAWYFTPALACLGLGWFARRNRADGKPAPTPADGLLLVAVWIAAPVAAAWLLSVTDIARLFLYRYLIASAAAAPLVAGLLCAACPTRRWRAVAAIATIAAALAYATPSYYTQFSRDQRLTADRDENWRGAVAYLSSRDDRLPLLLYAGLIETQSYASSPDPVLRAYCVFPVNANYRLNGDRLVLPLTSLAAASSETCRATADRGGAWLLLRVPASNASSAVARSERLAESCGLQASVVEVKNFGGVTVVRMEVER